MHWGVYASPNKGGCAKLLFIGFVVVIILLALGGMIYGGC